MARFSMLAVLLLALEYPFAIWLYVNVLRSRGLTWSVTAIGILCSTKKFVTFTLTWVIWQNNFKEYTLNYILCPPNSKQLRTHLVFEWIRRKKESSGWLASTLANLIWLQVATWSLTSAIPWWALLKLFRHTLHVNRCGFPGMEDTNGHVFFHSCKNDNLYLKAPRKFIFFEGLGSIRETESLLSFSSSSERFSSTFSLSIAISWCWLVSQPRGH